MSLRRCTDAIRLAGLIAAALLAGCAGGPGPASTAEAGAEGERIVPSQARTLYEQAAASLAAGDLVDAELRFKEFLLQYPEFPGAWVNLSIIQSANDDLAGARESVDRALAADPDYPQALNQSGVLFRKNGNFLEAEAAYLKAVTVAPDYALAHYNLGVLNELYLQRLEAALQHFERYQELVGEDEQVSRWIVDLERRVADSQRTANVTE